MQALHQFRLRCRLDAMGQSFVLGLLLSAITGCQAHGGDRGQRATVLSIGDGDTIRVRINGKPNTVRLACIDAPETAQSPMGSSLGSTSSSGWRWAAR
jgi:endonuclease YncB( thermonuclease family)